MKNSFLRWVAVIIVKRLVQLGMESMTRKYLAGESVLFTDAADEKREAKVVSTALKVSETHDVEIPWGMMHVGEIVHRILETGQWEIDPQSIEYHTFYSTKRMFPSKVSYGSGRWYIPAPDFSGSQDS